MSEMKDIWGDDIRIDIYPHAVSINCPARFEGYNGDDPETVATSLDLDADTSRELITELKKALDEMEVM